MLQRDLAGAMPSSFIEQLEWRTNYRDKVPAAISWPQPARASDPHRVHEFWFSHLPPPALSSIRSAPARAGAPPCRPSVPTLPREATDSDNAASLDLART